MEMKVVVNVDDYCLTKSQIDGTIFAYQHGVVTSTSCLVTQRDELLEYGALKSQENPGLGVGLHLTLTLGECLTKGKTICKPDGTFYKQNDVDWDNLDEEEIYQEFKAQMERFIKFFGRKPDHIDSHHKTFGICDFSNIRHIDRRIADEYGIKDIRGASKNIIYLGSPYGHFNYESFTKLIDDAMDTGMEYIEIGCHAAFVDEELFEKSSYNYQRIQELKVLTSQEVLDYYKANNIIKATY